MNSQDILYSMYNAYTREPDDDVQRERKNDSTRKKS